MWVRLHPAQNQKTIVAIRFTPHVHPLAQKAAPTAQPRAHNSPNPSIIQPTQPWPCLHACTIAIWRLVRRLFLPPSHCFTSHLLLASPSDSRSTDLQFGSLNQVDDHKERQGLSTTLSIILIPIKLSIQFCFSIFFLCPARVRT